MTLITNVLIICTAHACLYGAAHYGTAQQRAPRASTTTWSTTSDHPKRSIEDISQAVVLINKASLPPCTHKIITVESKPLCVHYILLAMKNVSLRDQLLYSLPPHTQKRLHLSELLTLFCSHVPALKSYPFFIALFSFDVDNFGMHSSPSAQWILEMANEESIAKEPVCSVVHGYSRAYVSDPSIFLINPHTLAYENIHKRPHIAPLLAVHTSEATHSLKHAVQTIMDAPEKPFGIKIRTHDIALWLAPPITGSSALRRHVAPPTQDDCAACSML